MLKYLLFIFTAVLLSGCYEDTVVERRDYGRRHHVSYVSDRPYDDGYYRGDRRYYRDGYDDGSTVVYRADAGPYYSHPVRRRVTVGF